MVFSVLEECQGWGQRDGKLWSTAASRKGKHLRMEGPLRAGKIGGRESAERTGIPRSLWSHLYFFYGFRGDQTSSNVRCFSEQQNLIAFTCFVELSLPCSDLASSFQMRFLLVLGQPWIHSQTPTRLRQQALH